FSVGAYELSGINRAVAAHVCRAPAGFLDHDSEPREVPRFGSPIKRDFTCSFRDQHVLPESAERAAAARGVQQRADFRLVVRVLAWTRASSKNHRLAQCSHVGDM